jgi:hypothetical protein
LDAVNHAFKAINLVKWHLDQQEEVEKKKSNILVDDLPQEIISRSVVVEYKMSQIDAGSLASDAPISEAENEEEDADNDGKKLPLDISKEVAKRNKEEGQSDIPEEDNSVLAKAVSRHTFKSNDQVLSSVGLTSVTSSKIAQTNTYATYAAAYFNLGVSFEFLTRFDLSVQAF